MSLSVYLETAMADSNTDVNDIRIALIGAGTIGVSLAALRLAYLPSPSHLTIVDTRNNLQSYIESGLCKLIPQHQHAGLSGSSLMKPDRPLSTYETKGTKKAKARITANFCTNATGSDKLPPWFIGTAKRPNAFRARGLWEIDHLGAIWRSNKSAWMTHHIMKEWLYWFDHRMRCANKKVLLLMDNFSAHELAVEQRWKRVNLHTQRLRSF
jgi:hypothetical protein